jgi:hypothetical protein
MREPMSHQPLRADLGSRSQPTAGQQLERSLGECWGRLSTLHRMLDDGSATRPARPEGPSSARGPSPRAPIHSERDRAGVDAALTAISGAAHNLLRQLEAPLDRGRAGDFVEHGPLTSPPTGLTRWNVRSLDC